MALPPEVLNDCWDWMVGVEHLLLPLVVLVDSDFSFAFEYLERILFCFRLSLSGPLSCFPDISIKNPDSSLNH